MEEWAEQLLQLMCQRAAHPRCMPMSTDRSGILMHASINNAMYLLQYTLHLMFVYCLLMLNRAG